jgi:hypothetical protein
MSQQRTPHQLKTLAQTQALSAIERFSDQACLTHLAGARGYHDNIEWCVPTPDDPRFASVMVNAVRAPTRNRHFISTGSGIEQVAASGNEITIATTDVFNTDVVDGIATWLDGMTLPLQGVEFENDEQAADDPLRVMLVSAEQYDSFVKSTNFRTLQSNAISRGQSAKNHPVFLGNALLWRNILILKQPGLSASMPATRSTGALRPPRRPRHRRTFALRLSEPLTRWIAQFCSAVRRWRRVSVSTGLAKARISPPRKSLTSATVASTSRAKSEAVQRFDSLSITAARNNTRTTVWR